MKQLKIYAILLNILFVTACGGDGGGNNQQAPQPPKTYNQSVTLPAKGGTQNVMLNDLTSAVSSVSSTPDWLVISPQFYSSGAPSIKLETQENTTTEERRCSVTILAAAGDKVVLSVTQQASSNQEGTGIDDIHNNTTSQPAYAPSL